MSLEISDGQLNGVVTLGGPQTYSIAGILNASRAASFSNTCFLFLSLPTHLPHYKGQPAWQTNYHKITLNQHITLSDSNHFKYFQSINFISLSFCCKQFFSVTLHVIIYVFIP